MDSTVVIEPAYNALSDVRALFEASTAMLVTPCGAWPASDAKRSPCPASRSTGAGGLPGS